MGDAGYMGDEYPARPSLGRGTDIQNWLIIVLSFTYLYYGLAIKIRKTC